MSVLSAQMTEFVRYSADAAVRYAVARFAISTGSSTR